VSLAAGPIGALDDHVWHGGVRGADDACIDVERPLIAAIMRD
jgi:hypothetical protein